MSEQEAHFTQDAAAVAGEPGTAPGGSDNGGADDSPREIVIGWQALVLPLLLVAVIAGGWQFGRVIARTGAEASDPIAAVSVPGSGVAAGQADVGAAAPVVITVDPSTLNQSGAPSANSNTIYPLPERFHPLLDQPAPDFTMRLLGTDEEVSLSDFVGQPVLINFWATWCPPCRYEMPWLEKLHKDYGPEGLVVLAVDAGEKVPASMVEETVQRYIDSSNYTFPVLLGDNTYDVQRQYGVNGLPSTFMISPEGVVLGYHSGMYPNAATLEDHAKLVMPGHDPSGPSIQ